VLSGDIQPALGGVHFLQVRCIFYSRSLKVEVHIDRLDDTHDTLALVPDMSMPGRVIHEQPQFSAAVVQSLADNPGAELGSVFGLSSGHCRDELAVVGEVLRLHLQLTAAETTVDLVPHNRSGYENHHEQDMEDPYGVECCSPQTDERVEGDIQAEQALNMHRRPGLVDLVVLAEAGGQSCQTVRGARPVAVPELRLGSIEGRELWGLIENAVMRADVVVDTANHGLRVKNHSLAEKTEVGGCCS
jgi:hypothetical protein